MLAKFRSLGQRERALVFLTAIVLLAGVWYATQGDAEEEVATPAVDMDVLAADYEEYLGKIKGGAETLREWKTLADSLPPAETGERADLAFSNQLAQLCRDSGFANTPIDAPKIEPIKNVKDYELISARVSAEGTWVDIVKLMHLFENRGLIFREMDLKGSRDQDSVRATFTVSRIAPVPKETRRRPTRGRRSGSF